MTKSPRLWLPAFLLLAPPAYEILCAVSRADSQFRLYDVHDAVLRSLAWTCFAAAGACALLPVFREALGRHIESLSAAAPAKHAAWVGAMFIGILSWFWFVRYQQYSGFVFPEDTANAVSTAYNFIHYGIPYRSVEGINMLSQHFVLLLPMLSPLLLVWKSPLAVLFAECFFVASAPIGVYCLVFALTDSVLASFAGLLLAVSSPTIHEVLGAHLHNNSILAFVPWAAYFWRTGRRSAAAAAAVLFLSCGEEAPLAVIGFGLSVLLTQSWKDRRARLIGLGILCGGAALWMGELSILMHFARKEAAGSTTFSKMELFRQLVPPSVPTNHIAVEILSHPLRTAASFFGSGFSIYVPILRLLVSAGLFCFCAPLRLLPFLATAFPHLLARDDTPFAAFAVHYGAPSWGPLFWATSHGLNIAYRRLQRSGRQSLLLIWVLPFCGLGFCGANRGMLNSSRPRWRQAMPRLIELIPPNARVWADEYATAQLSERRWLAAIETGPYPSDTFHFKPDYVLVDWQFLGFAASPYREQVLTYLARYKYLKVAEYSGCFLFRAPTVSAAPETVPDRIFLPRPDHAASEKFLREIGLSDARPQMDAELESFGRMLTASPGSHAALTFLAYGNRQRGRFELAVKYFRALNESCSTTCASDRTELARTLNGAGLANAARNRDDLARVQFEEALRLVPDMAETLFNLAQVYARRSEWKPAIEYYDRALRLRPGDVQVRFQRAGALLMIGRKDEACLQFKQVLMTRIFFPDPPAKTLIRNLCGF